MNRTGLLPLLGVLCLSLTACESMDSAFQSTKSAFTSMGNRIGSIDLPSLGSDNEDITEATVAEDDTAMNGDCPLIETTDALSEIHLFKDPTKPVSDTRISSLMIRNVTDTCRHRGDNVIVEVSIDFIGELGPAGRISSRERPSFAYPYFIAIEGVNGNILAKEVFATTVSYNNEQTSIAKTESMRQIIPLARNTRASDYKIFIGFQLSEEELMYNQALFAVPSEEVKIKTEAALQNTITDNPAEAAPEKL